MMQSTDNPGIEYFNVHAVTLAAEYVAMDRAKVHTDLLRMMPEKTPLKILDIGAGSGADAAMFADMGHDVVAAEPAEKLRGIAEEIFHDKAVQWNDEALPLMGGATDNAAPFDVVIGIGVLQYLDEKDRQTALHKMFSLVAPDGLLQIQYPTPASRVAQFTVAQNEICDAMELYNAANLSVDPMRIAMDKTIPVFNGRKALDGSDLYFRTIILHRPSQG